MDERKIIKNYAKKILKGKRKPLALHFIVASILWILSIPLPFLFFLVTFAESCWFLNFVRTGEKEFDHYFAPVSSIDFAGKIIITRIVQGLWILANYVLIIVPGIYKSVNLSQVKFLLKDKPQLKIKQLYKLSKDMMRYHKFDYIVFKLSFVPMYVLSFFTFGLGLLWTMPYKKTCEALYFERLRSEYEYAHPNTFDLEGGVILPDATTAQ